VRRATSCDVSRSSRIGSRSFTHGDSVTETLGRGGESAVLDGETNLSEFINDLHVWFRSFRAKLSLSRVDYAKNKPFEYHVSRDFPRNANQGTDDLRTPIQRLSQTDLPEYYLSSPRDRPSMVKEEPNANQ
jgi:hypothetical protein